MVKLFDLCYSEYAWDSLSKWFIGQFYFTKTIATMQKKATANPLFFGDKRLLSQTLSTGWRIR
ncbi:hypothetical protein [Streptococcus pneumoniae]|uniref:hypothetical protein n=1 Tax=Streptococcus pneumoniae TaxID=1313 RepID=UPI00099140D1|nr:hypothetical protein [Streptococcus pneumoniae]